MEATWLQLSKQDDFAESDGDKSDTDSVTLEESEDFFPVRKEDEMDKMEEEASFEVRNFDI